MLFDGYELSVLVGGKKLPEVPQQHRTFVVAQPGSEFQVRVARPKDDTARSSTVKVIIAVSVVCRFRLSETLLWTCVFKIDTNVLGPAGCA